MSCRALRRCCRACSASRRRQCKCCWRWPRRAERGLERGARLAAASAACDILPELAVELVRVGEETGDLAPMLLKAGDVLRQEFETTSAGLLAVITPVAILVLGLLIGAVA